MTIYYTYIYKINYFGNDFITYQFILYVQRLLVLYIASDRSGNFNHIPTNLFNVFIQYAI